jgi:recombination protein RecA
MGVELEAVDKSGSWYSFEGERIGQGRENVKAFLTDNPDIFASIETKVREALGLTGPAPQEKGKEQDGLLDV